MAALSGPGIFNAHARGVEQPSQPPQAQAHWGQQAQHAQQGWHGAPHGAAAVPDPCQRNAFDYGGAHPSTQGCPPDPPATRDPLVQLHPPNGNTAWGHSGGAQGRASGGAATVQSTWTKPSSQALVRPVAAAKSQGQRTLLQSWCSQGPASQQQHHHQGQISQQQHHQQQQQYGHLTQPQFPQQQQQQQQQAHHGQGAQHMQPSSAYGADTATPTYQGSAHAPVPATGPGHAGVRDAPGTAAGAHPAADNTVDLTSDDAAWGAGLPGGAGAAEGVAEQAKESGRGGHAGTPEAALVDVATTTGDIKLHR